MKFRYEQKALILIKVRRAPDFATKYDSFAEEYAKKVAQRQKKTSDSKVASDASTDSPQKTEKAPKPEGATPSSSDVEAKSSNEECKDSVKADGGDDLNHENDMAEEGVASAAQILAEEGDDEQEDEVEDLEKNLFKAPTSESLQETAEQSHQTVLDQEKSASPAKI